MSITALSHPQFPHIKTVAHANEEIGLIRNNYQGGAEGLNDLRQHLANLHSHRQQLMGLKGGMALSG